MAASLRKIVALLGLTACITLAGCALPPSPPAATRTAPLAEKPAPPSAPIDPESLTEALAVAGDDYGKDYELGQPWELAEGGTDYFYSNVTVIAVTDDGRAWGYILTASDMFPPAMSDILYLGGGYSPDDFYAAANEATEPALAALNRTSGGINYVLVRGHLDPPEGKEWGAMVETDRSVERLRNSPWYEQIKSKAGIDLNDDWWNGKSFSEPTVITCGDSTLEAFPLPRPDHMWRIPQNNVNVPESTLLRDGCKIG